jgi:putative ABC transport system permease protein
MKLPKNQHGMSAARRGEVSMPIRIAFRTLRRSPWFAIASVGIVALAISLASTVFAVVDGVLFKRLPYKDPDGLVLVFRTLGDPARLAQLRRGTGRSGQPFSADDLMQWRGAEVLSIAAFVSNFGLGPVAGGDVSDATTWAARVDNSFFDVLGMRPLAGGFREDHYRRPFESGKLSAHPAIISYRLWRRIGGEAALPGRLLRVGDGTLDVVGVLPPDFVFPVSFARTAPDVLLPLNVTADSRNLHGIGRLAPGVSHSEALARLDSIVLESVTTALGSRERPIFRMTLAAVVAVLLLGSLNVAVLLSARRRDRASELAVRTALGASTAQLLQLLVAEATVIALAGAGVGVAAAKPMLAAALTLLPTGYLLIKPPAIDIRVVAFAFAAATSTLLAFAAWPAFRVARSSAYAGLRQNSGATRTSGRVRRVALAAQSAIGIVVVLSGTLLLAGFATLWREDPGIERSNTAIVDVTARAIRAPAQRALALDEAVRVASRVPGVLRVSGFGGAFLVNAIGGSVFETPPGALDVIAQDVPVSSGFFETSGIRLISGRALTDDEATSGRPAAVVSDDLARAFWPGREAIGQLLSGPRGAVTVVGVVQDVRIVGLEERQATAEIYVPMAIAAPQRDRVLLLRSAGDPDDAARAVAAAIRRALPDVLITRAASIDTALAGTVKTRQFQAALFGAFGCAALVLLGVGMFGAVAMNTAGRSREIGVRMALGATAARVHRMVIAENLAPVAAGLLVGILGAWWTTKLLASLIYGAGAHDPRLWALAASFVLATALVAAWLPARRASRVDPQVVLKDN